MFVRDDGRGGCCTRSIPTDLRWYNVCLLQHDYVPVNNNINIPQFHGKPPGIQHFEFSFSQSPTPTPGFQMHHVNTLLYLPVDNQMLLYSVQSLQIRSIGL